MSRTPPDAPPEPPHQPPLNPPGTAPPDPPLNSSPDSTPGASPAPVSARDQLRANLRLVAALGATITYHEAARGIGLTPPHVIHSVTQLLEELMDEDAAHGHPFIAALVVSRVGSGLPAVGFFECAERLGRFTGAPWSEEAIAFHAAESVLACAFHALRP